MIESKEIKNPFPGLRPFETDEYRLFFGREGQSDALIARLQRSHFLAVVGTSGSGKSSLVRAGLLPALRGGLMAGAGSGWRIAIMRPGNDPIGNLAIALADKETLLEAGGGLPPAEAEAVIDATLRRGSLGLVEVARQARLDENEKLLLVVDQFEELFRFRATRQLSSTGDDASAFVKLLLEASQQQELSIYVVPTMRSDFLGDCAQFQGLPEAINDGQYLIPRMTRDERRFAITGPVGVTRGKITEPLVNRLMNDVGDNPDQLPILQHALMRTWDHWARHRLNGEPIGLEHYEAVGTMSDALSEHADEAFNELPNERSRQIAEILFKALTERGVHNREVRRPTCLKDICQIADATPAEVTSVIDVFRGGGRSFLMPPAGVPLTPETVIDISHESLIRNWVRLREWVKEEAESARIYRRLAEAAMDYRGGAGGLLDDVTLQYVITWREKAQPDRAWAARYPQDFAGVMSYLEESRVARDLRVASEHERERRELETARAFAEKQARSARRLRILSAAVFIIMLFALGTAAYAFIMKQSAEASEKQTRILAGDLETSRLNVIKAKADAEAVQRRADETETIAKADEKTARAAKEEAARATDAAAEAKQQAARDKEIAAQNLEVAHVARRDAEANAKEIQEAGERDDLLRKSFQARQRADMKEALDYLEQLKAKLEPGATSAPSSNMSAERINHFVLELGSTLSDIGDIHRQSEEFDKAIENYEAALVKLNQVLPENSKDPMLFGAYHGLAHSYQGYSRNLRPEKNKAVDYDERRKYLDKAEVFFKKALDYQVENRKDNPKEIAGGLLGLARLYSDLDNDPETVRNYRLAIDKLKESNPNEAHNALKEFAQFHRDAGRYAEAAQLYNELITSQEDITIDEFADKGQEIANVYNELADVYRADGDEKKAQLAAIRAKAKDEGRELNEAEQQLAASIQLNIQQLGRLADNGFSVADVIQRVSLKLKRNDAGAKLNLDDDLDEMGDAYVKLGKFSDAEVIYNKALDFRKEHPEKEQFIWKSYDKLATLYRENLKDDQTAAKYNDLLVNLLKDKKDSSNRYVDSIVQLAALYAKDPNRYGEAEALYQRALGIATAQDDWQYPNLILYQLGQLHLKQKRGVDREQMIRRRLEILTRYFNRLAGPAAQRPRSPNTLVTEYLNAIEAMVFITKNPADAEAVYQPASAGYTSITRAIFNPKVLESYKSTLEHYKNLLSTNGKPTETVNGQIDGLTEKLTQLNQIYTQNPAVQQGPGTYPTAP